MNRGGGPRPSPEGAAAGVRDDLTARAATLADAAARVRSGDDGEAIHDLRVASRRLAAALAMARPLVGRRVRRAARRDLRGLRRALGPLRDAEVALAALETHRTGAPAALRRALAPLLRRLRERVGRGRARAARAGILRRVERVRGLVTGAARRVERRAAARPGWPVQRRARLAARASAACDALAAAVARPQDEALHRARVAVKGWRYAEECVARPDRAPDTLALLKQAQERLGRARDTALLARRLARAALRRAAADDAGARALRALAGALEAERPAELAALEPALAALRRLAPAAPVPAAPQRARRAAGRARRARDGAAAAREARG